MTLTDNLILSQEQHHYTSKDSSYTPLETLQARDAMKQDIAKTKDLTLVLVPCWWDGKKERYPPCHYCHYHYHYQPQHTPPTTSITHLIGF